MEPKPHTRIRSDHGWARVDLRELWAYRELLYILMWRDIKVRYKQTVLGAAWAILQPLAAMLIFTLVLGKLAHVPSNGIPYPVFAYSGLLLWQFFSKALTEASLSLVVNERVITKVYFPRLLVPSSVVVAGLMDFVIAFLLLFGLMAFYGLAISWTALLAPVFVLLAMAAALGVSFWLSALDVKYRDVRYTLPFLTQIWLFATPVVYPSSLVPAWLRPWYGLNPMAGVVEGFRWSLLGGATTPNISMICISMAAAGAVLLTGLLYFRAMEQTLADLI
jgi:lipopolysaccharide transport system permease protein